MEAKELRIGNLYIDTCGAISTWSENSFNHYKLAKVPLSELKPIPLTEDWLLKFGFEKHTESFVKGCLGLQNTDIDLNFDYWVVVYIDVVQSIMPITNIKHVHQLQNLYFALTQTELIIK